MSQETRYFRVGAFVLGGLALVLVGVLVIAGSDLFREQVIIETVFDESVQGLEVGSPVKVRGVTIGEVSWIGFVSDAYSLESAENPLVAGNLVLVRMQIEPRGQLSPEQRREYLAAQVGKGFRLRLTPIGITGISFIQADYVRPESLRPIQLPYQPEYLYVPSAPSTIAQLSSGAERLMARIDQLDVEGLLTNFDTLLESLNELVGTADVDGIGDSARTLLADLRRTSAEARQVIDAAGLPGVSRDAREALDQVVRTMARLERVLDASGDDLSVTLGNLRVTSENLREASETARAYPSLLLFGAPPPRPVVPGED